MWIPLWAPGDNGGNALQLTGDLNYQGVRVRDLRRLSSGQVPVRTVVSIVARRAAAEAVRPGNSPVVERSRGRSRDQGVRPRHPFGGRGARFAAAIIPGAVSSPRSAAASAWSRGGRNFSGLGIA